MLSFWLIFPLFFLGVSNPAAAVYVSSKTPTTSYDENMFIMKGLNKDILELLDDIKNRSTTKQQKKDYESLKIEVEKQLEECEKVKTNQGYQSVYTESDDFERDKMIVVKTTLEQYKFCDVARDKLITLKNQLKEKLGLLKNNKNISPLNDKIDQSTIHLNGHKLIEKLNGIIDKQQK